MTIRRFYVISDSQMSFCSWRLLIRRIMRFLPEILVFIVSTFLLKASKFDDATVKLELSLSETYKIKLALPDGHWYRPITKRAMAPQIFIFGQNSRQNMDVSRQICIQ